MEAPNEHALWSFRTELYIPSRERSGLVPQFVTSDKIETVLNTSWLVRVNQRNVQRMALLAVC